MSRDKVKAFDGKDGLPKIFTEIVSPTCRKISTKNSELMSLSSSRSEHLNHAARGPFTDLIICVTGLSKEARKQVMDATERLGGQYSSTLHPQCTHLVAQSFGGRKFEHALKHGSKSGLSIVTLGWFVDCVRRNVRMSESLYSVKWEEGRGLPSGELNRLVGFTSIANSCLPVMALDDNKLVCTTSQRNLWPYGEEFRSPSLLSNTSIYIDETISSELKQKVVEIAAREGANFLDRWYVGCSATYVVCEGASIRRYIGYTGNLVTPLWMLKSIKERHMQRLVHLSSDLARQVGTLLEHSQSNISRQDADEESIVPIGQTSGYIAYSQAKSSLSKRKNIVDLAKQGIRSRRCLIKRMPRQPISSSNLLESICWSVSEPTISAGIYEDWHPEERSEASISLDANEVESEASFRHASRLLRESEKREIVFKYHFLTILFPVDRFSELGPSSRTFFSSSGFTCMQVLDHVYNFYQENMTPVEINLAIHTDSRHADGLRSVYAGKESLKHGRVPFRRIDFLGSRRSFEALKRVGGENNGNVYELLIIA